MTLKCVEPRQYAINLSDVNLFNALAQAAGRTYLKAGPAIFNKYLIQKAVPALAAAAFGGESDISPGAGQWRWRMRRLGFACF